MTDTPAGGRRTGEPLGRMAVPKRSEVLVGELRDRILGGELPPGSMLPPERTMAEQTGLSRMTVREALRSLEAEGLVEIRPGRTGGAVVRRLDGSGVSRHLDLYIRSQEVPLEMLFEVREALAPSCAALAARRRTDADVAELTASTDRLAARVGDQRAFLDEYLAWHILLSRVARNDVMRAVMESTTRGIWTVTGAERFADKELRDLAVRSHRRVVEAIAAGDEDAARRRMHRHVAEFTGVMRAVPGLPEMVAPLAEPAAPEPL